VGVSVSIRILPEIPTLFDKISKLKIRRVAVSTSHSAGLTDEGMLYTWPHHNDIDDSAGKPIPGCTLPCPRRVDNLAGMRIVSVATLVSLERLPPWTLSRKQRSTATTFSSPGVVRASPCQCAFT
jgi:hypothetical protein